MKKTNKKTNEYYFRRQETENDSSELIMVKQDGTPVTYKDLCNSHYSDSLIIRNLLVAMFACITNIMTSDNILAEDAFERYLAVTNIYLRHSDVVAGKALEETKKGIRRKKQKIK